MHTTAIRTHNPPAVDPHDGLAHQALDIGLQFKARTEIFGRRSTAGEIRNLLVTDLPIEPMAGEAVLAEFVDRVLPLCKNEASPRFMGFGDTGDDHLALAGSVLATLTQQNMINQSFDSPSATFIEITVLRWLRGLLGYANPLVGNVNTVWDVGGMVTPGGTTSNTVAMMLAREAKAPGTMQSGVADPSRFAVVVPRGIGHYSVKAALTWIGCGAHIIEVATDGFRYNTDELARTLREHRDRVMAVIAYAGDSRTQTIDDLRAVHDVVRAIDPKIWLHADACWGLLAAFSPNLRDKIDGIAEFDSITVDPHKIMAVPYGLSALLVRDPAAVRTISTYSDLIMQEDFAFGQVTPFIGTKGWMSLKLWMMMLGRGRAGLVELADHRHEVAQTFAGLVDAHPRLVRLNDLDLAAVVFAYLPAGIEAGNLDDAELDRLNRLNIAIHARMMDEGRWHLHQFTLPDDLGRLRSGAVVHPLRYGEQSRGHRDLYARRPCLPRQPRTRSGGRNSMTNKTFRAVYESAGVYDELLLRHYYGGTEDVDLVANWLTEHHRAPTASFEVVEFGCGTGRITETIAPYARNLVLADYSETMVSAVAQKFPAAQTICADTSDAVTTLLREGRSKSFDLVTAFWSLSYPIGEFFEELSPTGVRPRQDQVHAHTQAREFVLDLVRLVAPGGHLLAMLFDAESPEQQLVTRGWEAVAPFPVGGRAYTRNVLVDALRDAEEQGIGALTHTRLGGVAWASSREAAREWFFGVHFKHHPQLLDDPELAISVEEFIDRYEIAGGVALPSGVHFVDFHAAAHPYASLPIGLSS